MPAKETCQTAIGSGGGRALTLAGKCRVMAFPGAGRRLRGRRQRGRQPMRYMRHGLLAIAGVLLVVVVAVMIS